MKLSSVALMIALAFGILATPLVTAAQQATKVHRIGWLLAGFPPSETMPYPHYEAFRQRLRDLGYVEGQNLVIEDRYAKGRAEQLPDLAAELVRLKVDVIVTSGTATIHAAQHATRTIPIVMASTYDPVGEGFVASLAQPGGTSRA